MGDIFVHSAEVPKHSTIQVDAETVKAFKAACEAMPQSPKMTRAAIGLLRWFARRSELVKTAVISGVDAGMEPIYAKALRETADELERKSSKPDVGEIGKPPKSREPRAASGTERSQLVGGHRK